MGERAVAEARQKTHEAPPDLVDPQAASLHRFSDHGPIPPVAACTAQPPPPTLSERAFDVRPSAAEARASHDALHYVVYNQSRFLAAIRDRIAGAAVPPPHERLAWGDGCMPLPVACERALVHVAGSGVGLASALPELLYPADPWTLVDAHRDLDEGRPGEPWNGHGARGPLAWSELSGAALAVEIVGALRRSLPRMGARYVAQADTAAHHEAITPDLLVASHPFDRVVARLVCDPGVVKYARPHGRVERREGTFAKGLRVVSVTWLAGTLWNWVRAEPADATAEEVAAALFERLDGHNHSEYAYALRAAPPFFRVPLRWAREHPGARDRAPAVDHEQDDALELADSPLADEAARAQTGPPAARVDLPALERMLRTNAALLALAHDRLAPWRLEYLVMPASRWLDKHLDAMHGTADRVLRGWSSIAAEQQGVLAGALASVLELDAFGRRAKLGPDSDEAAPVRDVLRAIAVAIGESHLARSARDQLAVAGRAKAALPVALVERSLREERAAARELAAASANGHAAGQRDEARAELAALESGALHVRDRLAGGEPLDGEEIEQLALASREATLRARLVATHARLSDLRDAVQDAAGGSTWAGVANAPFGSVRSLPRALTAIQTDVWEIVEALRRDAMPAQVPDDPRRATAAFAAARRDAVARASSAFDQIKPRLDALLHQCIDAITEAERRTAVLKIVVAIAEMVALGWAGGAAGAAAGGLARGALLADAAGDAIALARGARLARGVGFAANVLAAEAVNTLGQAALFGDDAMSFRANVLAHLLTLGVMRPIHALAASAAASERAATGLWKIAARGKAVLVEGASLTAEVLVNAGTAYVVARVTAGEMPASDDVAVSWAMQGAAIAIGRYVGHKTADLMERAQAWGERGLHLRKRAAAQAKLVREIERSGDAASAAHSLDEHARLLDEEAALLRDPAAAATLGLDARQVDALRAGNAAAIADTHGVAYTTLGLRLHGLAPATSDGTVWSGTRAQIEAALHGRGAMFDPATRRWSVTIDGRELVFVEVEGGSVRETEVRRIADQRDDLRRAGVRASELRYDEEAHAVYYEAAGATVRAQLPPRIATAEQLVDPGFANRIVGRPVDASTGTAILRAFVAGDATAFAPLGIAHAVVPAGVELGLGRLADGRVIVVRGAYGQVDFAALPGFTPIAHTHPSIPGNDLMPERATHLPRIAPAELNRPTASPLINRELVWPSAEDFIVLAHARVREHAVFTSYVVDELSMIRKPAPGERRPRLELLIKDPREIGVRSNGKRVFHATVEATTDHLVFRDDVWIVETSPGTGHLEMEEPDGLARARVPRHAPTAPAELAAHERTLERVVRSVVRGDAVVVRVLDRDAFAERFRSELGRAVFVLEGEARVIYARADATERDVIDETYHLRQMRDPELAAKVRRLNRADFARWDKLSVTDRIELVRYKLELEIDAHERMVRDGREHAGDALVELRARLDELDALPPDRIGAMNAGLEPAPAYLRDPAYLFEKRKHVGARAPVEGAAPHEHAIREVSPAGPERSAAYTSRDGVEKVSQLGGEWLETHYIVSDVAGTVSTRMGARGMEIVVADDAGGEHAFVVEERAELQVPVGRRVEVGADVAIERQRRYREVKIDFKDGHVETRFEIRLLGDDGGWVQRGSESTRRGRLAEAAAAHELDARLAIERIVAASRGQYVEHMRIPRVGPGGFDDVVVTFSGSKEKPSARIRIREVKWYPDRYVPAGEFTAIDENLRQNLEALQKQIEATAHGEPPAGFDPKVTAEQLDAVRDALIARDIEIEIVLGPKTHLGHEGKRGSVLAHLRQRIREVTQKDALVAEPTVLDQTKIDAEQSRSTP